MEASVDRRRSSPPPTVGDPGRPLARHSSAVGPVLFLDFGVFAFLSFSLGPAGDCPCRP